MFAQIIAWLKKFFRIEPATTSREQQENSRHAREYGESKEINITAILANRISNIVCSESTTTVIGGQVDITGEDGRIRKESLNNPRSIFLDKALQRCVNDLNLITTRMLGIGGVVLKPYVYKDEIYTDVISQNRYFVIEQVGSTVTKAAFWSDTLFKEYNT